MTSLITLFASSEQTKQQEEHIDEIKIKLQSAQNRDLFRTAALLMDLFEPLGVIGREPDENRKPRVGDDPIKKRGVEKEIDETEKRNRRTFGNERKEKIPN